jgi:hypothetical protein
VGEAGLAVASTEAVGETGSGVGEALGVSLANLTGWQAVRSSAPPASKDSMLRLAIFISINLLVAHLYGLILSKNRASFPENYAPGCLIVRRKLQFGCNELYFSGQIFPAVESEAVSLTQGLTNSPPHPSLRWQLTAVCPLTASLYNFTLLTGL